MTELEELAASGTVTMSPSALHEQARGNAHRGRQDQSLIRKPRIGIGEFSRQNRTEPSIGHSSTSETQGRIGRNRGRAKWQPSNPNRTGPISRRESQ